MKQLHNLELIRKSKGYSRRELSLLSGIKQGTIQKLEKGLYNVDMVKLGTLIALAKALHCRVRDLLDNDLKRIVG